MRSTIWYRQRYLLLMSIPGVLLVLIFKYFPMYGILIAFKNYDVAAGILQSPWVGLKHFYAFFNNPFSWRIIKNTFLLGLYSLFWGFPAPLILALLLNEVKKRFFKRWVQTIVYFPHFLSVVIIVGFLKEFAALDGLFNQIGGWFGAEAAPLLAKPEYFRTLFIGSSIWQSVGWGTIIYLAALSGVDEALHEAAIIDGANRWQRLWNVTWPAILPATTILLILSLGGIVSTDFQKVLLLYNPSIYETADVIDTYVYRQGILGAQYEYSTAVGLMLSVISFLFVTIGNWISRKFSETSLW
ncbi:ABC transporter permease [Paenibacillus dokdonensis]|uniref:ABC transporter permease n=1 Tax=Paenibacillus dokdonensis TaxID=2567944 RepID=UPI001FEC6DC7|nr:ABC transporter permease subunit [Paenibacillus dokdonensis]